MSSTLRRNRIGWRAALLGVALLAAGCRVIRLSVGSELRADPAMLKVGQSTIAQVLEAFGAPEHIQRQSRGDVFIYRYLRRDTRTVNIEEPVVTNTELYTYTTIREDSDRLVVLFDDQGIVTGYGYQRGASQM